ncbi:MAG: light-harvesting antenna LH1, beta subunit [Sphingomonadaceae bacterium]
MSSNKEGPLNYLTDDEAKEVHKLFVMSMAFFVGVACIAHFLMWMWRPWFPGTEPYKNGMAMLESGAHYAQTIVTTLFA